MVTIMTKETKDKIRELEGEKIILEDRLEHLSYSGNLVKMHEIESEIYEIEDTIRKLTAQNGSFQVVDGMAIRAIMNYVRRS